MTFESLNASRQHYQCVECGAFDALVLIEGERAPEAINCMSCGSGRGIPDVDTTYRAGKGMRKVTVEHRNMYDKATSPKDYERLGMTGNPSGLVESNPNIN